MDGERGDVVVGLGGYNPKTETPSSRDKRFSTGGVVAGYAARPVSSAKAAPPVGGGRGPERGTPPRNGVGTGGPPAAAATKSRSKSPPNQQRARGGAGNGSGAGGGATSMTMEESMAAAASRRTGGEGGGVGVDADSDVVMDLGDDDNIGGGRPKTNGGGGSSPGRRVGDLIGRPSIAADGRRSSAGRASGGFNNFASSNGHDGGGGGGGDNEYGGGDNQRHEYGGGGGDAAARDVAPQHTPRGGNATAAGSAFRCVSVSCLAVKRRKRCTVRENTAGIYRTSTQNRT